MKDLFTDPSLREMPLAARMRPQSLSEFYGQSHLVGEGRVLAEAAKSGHLHSMILWGPPGTGKTTLAQLLAERAEAMVAATKAKTVCTIGG